MKANQLKLGSILSYLKMFISIVISLIYTPFMLNCLGQNEYGLYSTVSSTISMLAILKLGFSSSYIKYFMKYKVDNDDRNIAKLNGLYLLIFSFIGCIALFCGIFLSFNLNMVFSTGLTFSEYQIARKLMILLTINLSFSFPMTLFTNVIMANEKYIFLKIMGMLRDVLSPLVTIPLLLSGFRSVALVTSTITLSLLTDVIYLYYTKKFLHIKFSFTGFPTGLFKSLIVYSTLIAIHLIVDQVNTNVDKVLLGRFQGTQVVAIYTIGYSLHHYFMLFSTAISSVFTPRIHKIINQTKDNIIKQKQQLTDIFVKVGRIQFIIVMLIATGLLFFGKVFINLWVGPGFDQSYYVVIILSFSVSIDLIQNIGIEIQRALNKQSFRTVIYTIMAVINITLTIILCQKYGAVGAAVGTAISYLLANGLVINIYYHKKCNIDIVTFWKKILRLSLSIIIPLVAGSLINHYFSFKSYFELGLGIIIYTSIYFVSVWFLGLNTYEKSLVLKPVSKIIKIKSIH